MKLYDGLRPRSVHRDALLGIVSGAEEHWNLIEEVDGGLYVWPPIFCPEELCIEIELP